ncbi:YciI family protein, partial [Rhizobium leguminosarum]|uniref:YciI family protein n=1 Tax=Rhizobium leguminosarum TaxID=384 RepID=UPI003F94B9B6
DGKPCGSLIIVEAESKEAARALADADPYAAACLLSSIRWKPNSTFMPERNSSSVSAPISTPALAQN